MRPTLSIHNLGDSLKGYSVNLREFRKRLFWMAFSYFYNLRRNKLVHTVNLPKGGSSLSCPVSHVVSLRPQEKMIRTDARRIITMMEYVKSIVNWAVGNNPRRPVRQHVSAANKPHEYKPVSRFVFKAIPVPATIRFFKLGIESFNEIGRKTLRTKEFYRSIVLHIKSFLMCHASGCSYIAEALHFTPTEGGIKWQ